ncbi:hypothetical protein EMIHUDRAFT_468947 [Emiliania huxleyi CCMP1516]|uniref:Chromo domain-containing protein n=2 Tax=Emiliania huxleyi TaxID=2903 RepID=A0A0D3JTL7_EMIH1|nr:hypothetical protein EMIHUDRAFT_468947 [Emiliania huxleyi CCMP1516]EOD26852.1 hypothetical protein EMIHUDRAFT_468947 [Emiliania huxleyi CCMP1516]|eukprot:XP_005779281.1 hypothetical protein EMIHUDRAFT_468947 [Emiliania huxleyi CCMP1516]
MEDELALVSSCQSLRRGQVWVHWLGYGAERSCWVDATSEVEATGCPDSADVLLPGIDAPKVYAAMSLIESPDAEAEAAAILGRPVSGGRSGGGGDVSPVKKRRRTGWAGGGRRSRKPKAPRKAYEKRVHIITVSRDGVRELREIRRTIGGGRGAKAFSSNGEPSAAASEEEEVGAAGDRMTSPEALSSSPSTSTSAEPPAEVDAAGGAAAREVSGGSGSNEGGSGSSGGSSPRDCSAWIGLFDAEEFDWSKGAPRPRYLRYKPLTSAKGEGTVRWPLKALRGIGDSDFLFSIDSGTFELCAGPSHTFPVSQRLRVRDDTLVALVGAAHGCVLPPRAAAAPSRAAPEPPRAGDALSESEEEESSDEEEAGACPLQPLMFAVPQVEIEVEERKDVKQVYALADRLSYHDWGLCSKDATLHASRRNSFASAAHGAGSPRPTDTPTGAAAAAPPPGEGAGSVGDDALGRREPEPSRRESVDSLCGEGAVLPGRGDLTTVTSEGYGEATLGTCERLVRLLMRLTECVPAMEGWGGGWNLDADATLLDIGSGYGKVVVHAKLLSRCRAAHGLECALDDDLLRGVSFCCADATREAVQPVAKMRFVTTGRERCTVFIYVNAQFVPGV